MERLRSAQRIPCLDVTSLAPLWNRHSILPWSALGISHSYTATGCCSSLLIHWGENPTSQGVVSSSDAMEAQFSPWRQSPFQNHDLSENRGQCWQGTKWKLCQMSLILRLSLVWKVSDINKLRRGKVICTHSPRALSLWSHGPCFCVCNEAE